MKINNHGVRIPKRWFAVEHRKECELPCREKPVRGHQKKGQERGDGVPYKYKKGAGVMQEITEKDANGNISHKIQEGLAVEVAVQGEGGWMPIEEDTGKAPSPKEAGEEGADVAALEEENASLRASFEPLYMQIGKNFYEKPKGYELAITETVHKLAGMDDQIHRNYLRILRLKGIRYCPFCERIVDDVTVFCADCGTRIDPVEDVDESSTICPCCSAKNSRDNNFCIICGQKLKEQEEQIRCPNCGIHLPADARFCEECGAKLA